jgi:hypothetical protein
MDTTSWAWKIFEIASPVITFLLTAALAAGVRWLSAHTQSEYLRQALVRLNDTVATAVKDVQQRTVDAIRKDAPDGKISPEQAAKIKADAIAIVKDQLGAKGLTQLATVLGISGGAIDALLGSRIEAAVHDLKEDSAAARPFSTVPAQS